VRLPGFVLQVHLRDGAASVDAPIAVTSPGDGDGDGVISRGERAVGGGSPRLGRGEGGRGRPPLETTRRHARGGAVPRVLAVSRAAAAAGVQPGMTIPQAQAASSSLRLLPCDEALVRGAVTTLAEALLGLSPTVEPHVGWVFFAAGTAATATSARPRDVRLAHAAHRVVESLRFTAHVVVADERFTAAAVAHGAAAPVLVVAPGASAAALAPLPLGLLPLTADISRGLHLLGLRTLGDFARLTELQVAARWGRPGVMLHRLARGIDPTPLQAFAPPERLAEELRLDPPVTTLDALDLGLERLAAAVALRLQGRGAGATHVRVVVALDHAPPHTLTLCPTRPVATARPLRALIAALLAESRFTAPVAGVTVVVDQAVPVRPASLDLFAHRRERAGHELDMCLVRLRAFLGEPAVHGVKLTESYRPEAMYEPVPFAPPDEGAPPAAARAWANPDPRLPEVNVPTGALRLLDPPVPVDLDEGPPPLMRAFGGTHRIARARGPLRLSGEWWREAGFARDYFEVVLEDGAHYWLYRDESGHVFAQGVMD
jgi:protein ImuB